MGKRFYLVTRDLHLYLGLFVSPFVVVFSLSVFWLVHRWVSEGGERSRTVLSVTVPAELEKLGGRARVEALQRVLPAMGVAGEIGFVRYVPKERRLVFPVSVPGRETVVDLNLETGRAAIRQRETGVWDGLVALHKLPGPHLVDIRMNWAPMKAWRWFADGTVYLLLFVTISGVYLWAVLRGERRAGLGLLAAGAVTFLGVVYAVVRQGKMG